MPAQSLPSHKGTLQQEVEISLEYAGKNVGSGVAKTRSQGIWILRNLNHNDLAYKRSSLRSELGIMGLCYDGRNGCEAHGAFKSLAVGRPSRSELLGLARRLAAEVVEFGVSVSRGRVEKGFGVDCAEIALAAE